MPNCTVCGRPLKEAQFRENERYKACPNCSKENGEQHVYYECSGEFGTTEACETSTNPNGYKSHCTTCRGKGNVYGHRILCSEF